MEQLNSNIERVIEPNSTIEVLNVGAFFALVKAYKYVVVGGIPISIPVREKINVPFSFDLYDKDNEKISTGTLSPGEKATFKVQSYKMLIRNVYDYEVHIVYSFGSGTVSQLKTDLEMTDRDLKALTLYDKRDFESLNNISQKTTESYEELDKITKIIEAATDVDKTPHLLQKFPIFINLDSATNTYFNVFDLVIRPPGGGVSPHFFTHIDIAMDYSQVHRSNTGLIVNNTFNPAMSFGHYDKLKTLNPDTQTVWNNNKWTKRADNKLPTKSSSLVIQNGWFANDGSFRIDINEPYGVDSYAEIDNFIIRTDIVYKPNLGAGNRKVAIRKYTDDFYEASADITEKVLEGNYDFKNYNKCVKQQPIVSTGVNMLVVDVTVYGYRLPNSADK